MLLGLIKWLLITLFAFLLLAIIATMYIPASFVPKALDYATNNGLIPTSAPKVDFFQLSGTLWNAKAEKAILTIDGGTVNLGALEWQLDPLAFKDSLLSIYVQTSADDHHLDAHIIAEENGNILIENAEGHLPIMLLEPWIPLLIDGKLTFVIDNWLFNNNRLIDINGVLNLESVDWLGGDRTMPLGSYMAHMSMEGDFVQIKVDDFNAKLAVDGLISISPVGNYRFQAKLQARDELAPEVAESILWFGKKDINGDIVLDRSGNL